MERTYIMLKPEALRRKIAGRVVSRIEDKGFKITKMETKMLNKEILDEHYAHITDKPFYPEIVENMTSGPVVAMVVEGEGVVNGMRTLMGPTQWEDALPGTIRGDFCNDTGMNVIHGSDSIENAEIEIKRFFPNL